MLFCVFLSSCVDFSATLQTLISTNLPIYDTTMSRLSGSKMEQWGWKICRRKIGSVDAGQAGSNTTGKGLCPAVDLNSSQALLICIMLVYVPVQLLPCMWMYARGVMHKYYLGVCVCVCMCSFSFVLFGSRTWPAMWNPPDPSLRSPKTLVA